MRWTLKPIPDTEKIHALSKALNISEVLAHLLVQRDVETYEEAKRFFRPELAHLHDPFLMKDMDKAVTRIEKAIKNQENILVYGDYDVDGTTSVALVSEFLEGYYSNVFTYIPDRYSEGYGISQIGIDFAYENNFSLIIALDCGIKAVNQVAYASEKGIDFVICDHHLPGDEIPNAVAVLDPKQIDCPYPYKELSGCGVGFKLIQALAVRRGIGIQELVPYLDLVATAIAADIVPITGENRVLAYHGLKVINTAPRAGIQAIIGLLKRKNTIDISQVVFGIAPRINAAGRMKHAKYAVELLREFDPTKAEEFAQEIEVFNQERRETDRLITEEALRQITENKEEDRKTTVVYHESWHKGVIGIVASRLTETYYRPTLVFTKSGDVLAASARSVKDFNVYTALEACTEYLEQFGGHKYAAGLTLKKENYAAFKEKFETVVTQQISSRLLTPELEADIEMELSEITPKFYRILKQFAPFGPGNKTPVFLTKNLHDAGESRCVGETKAHLKFDMYQDKVRISGIGFGLGEKESIVCSRNPFNALYCLDENTWNGETTIQLRVKDIKETVFIKA